MEITVWGQAYIFFGAVVCGLVIGFIYDIFRLMRRIVKTGAALVSVQDVAFWLVAAVIVFVYIFSINYGELRWYEFFGIAVGLLLYGLTLGRAMLAVLLWVYGVLSRVVVFMLKIILTPIAYIYKLIKRPFLIVVDISSRGFRRAGKSLLYFLKIVKKT